MHPPFLLQSLVDFAHARFSGIHTFPQTNAREVVLCPEEFERLRPAIILDGAFDRMDNYLSADYRQKMALSFSGGEIRHAPTLAYVFQNARISAGSFFSAGFRYRIRPPKEAGIPKKIDRLDQIALCASITGDQYFGHCLNEDLPQMLLAEGFGEPARLTSKNWPDLYAYRDLFGLNWLELDGAEIKEATIFWDFSQNSSRKERFQAYRSRLRERLIPKKPGGVFYLRRGDTGEARSPVNDDDICAHLEKRGVDVIDVAHNNAQDFLENCLERKIMISVEGSHMMHLVYTLMTGGGALALMPPLQPRCAIKDACDAIGARFATVVGHMAPDGFRIDLDALSQTLDKLETAVDNLESV
ncbi:MAG: glycosyltransferase 61 family protein [Pseudomonadota bacterium]